MSNDAMARTWASDAAGWVAAENTLDALFAPVTDAITSVAALGADQRVLDVGCGTGTLLERVAARGGSGVGVDISPDMVAAASARVPEARVELADAQSADLAELGGGPYDRVLSRFGVMFFADPAAAFANLRSSARSGARLVFASWREIDENPMFTLGQTVLNRRWDSLVDSRVPQDHTAPGPLSLADYTRVRSLLHDAGWGDVSVRPLDYIHDHGFDGSDGVESRLAVVLATSQGRRAAQALVPLIGESGWAEIVAEVREEIARHVSDGAVRYPGACWLVSATAP